jgi:lycopene cyclase domain-containing protein
MTDSYLLWLLLFVILPLVIIWIIYFRDLKRYALPIFLAPIGSIVFSVPWDYIAVHERIWYFQTPYIVGLRIGGLPLEEYFFIITITLLFSSVSALLFSRFGHQ